jgi:two-component system response regulator QseB/two-component system response regulator TctD
LAKQRRRILLVEDHAEILALLIEVLRDAGYDIDPAATFGEAREKLLAEKYDLLITDLSLPGGNGAELGTIAGSLGGKVLLITGHPQAMELMELQNQRYLAKPFLARDLIARVEAMWTE